MSYFIIVTIEMLLIMGINAYFSALEIISFNIDYIVASSMYNLCLILIIQVIIAAFVHLLPSKLFSPYRKRFRVYEWENDFYEKLKIKKWKSFVPDAGQFCNFRKRKLKQTDTKYLYKFLVETCYADSQHFWMGIGGFIILLFNLENITAMLTIALPIALSCLVLNLLPMIIQRYNRPKFLRVYEKKLEKEFNEVSL